MSLCDTIVYNSSRTLKPYFLIELRRCLDNFPGKIAHEPREARG